MDYKLHDFLPLYNQVQTSSFDRDINSLTEFVKYKLPKEEEFPQHPGDLMLHQKLISNFINPHTPYDGLLLVHEMGTGKTCTAVGVAERFIKNKALDVENSTFPSTILKNIIVLTKGKGLQSNFINEISNVCTSGQYLEGLDKYIRNRDMRIRKNVKVNYTFETFEIFSKAIRKMSKREQSIIYENTLFIVDEAHNLRMSSDPEESNIYREIYGLFKRLKRRKILLLTGTPMKDQPEEILDLMNLILREDLTLKDLNDKPVFKKKLKGYVSYLRAMMSEVDRSEQGQMMGTLEHFKVYPVVMKPLQSKIYMAARKKDDEERSIFNHSRQASSMVFPDGTYGKQGFENNVIQTSTGYRFNQKTQQSLTLDLNKYSAKYADLLDKIESDYSNGRLSFVFSEFVKGSGLLVLSILLELRGYRRAIADNNLSRPQKRYIILTNETSTDSQTRRLLAMFNNSKNMNGEYISTILGSRVIMEGFSFKNIQSEYILTPHWNYSETSQIIARGFRLGSHNDLIKAGIVPEVKIYHYVAVPISNQNNGSIDLYMYEIAEKKDFKIQSVIRTLKEAAFDCELNKERNTITNTNLNDTRTCEYTNCEYKCDNDIKIMVKDSKNSKLLYFRFSEDYNKLKNFVVEKVTTFPITIDEIMVQTSYSEFEVMVVLQDLLNFQEILFTRPEGSYYLVNTNNLFYADVCHAFEEEGSYDSDDPFLLNFYTKYTVIFNGKSIDELVYNHRKKFMVILIDKIFSSKNLIELQKYVVQLPIYLQEKLLCYAISTRNKTTPNNFVRDMVLNNFRLYYKLDGDKAYVWLNQEKYKCTIESENYKSWRTCISSEQRLVEQMKKDRKEVKVLNNPYGYIGLLNRTSNDFCIRKVNEGDDEAQDKRKRNVGKRCQNWKKKDLVDLVSNRIKVEPDEDFEFDETDVDKMKKDRKFTNILNNSGTLRDYKRVAFWNAQDVNYLCTKIMQNFLDKKLVIDDPNCGTSKKIR
jgi:superfamily II DNA or RNA helicase